MIIRMLQCTNNFIVFGHNKQTNNHSKNAFAANKYRQHHHEPFQMRQMRSDCKVDNDFGKILGKGQMLLMLISREPHHRIQLFYYNSLTDFWWLVVCMQYPVGLGCLWLSQSSQVCLVTFSRIRSIKSTRTRGIPPSLLFPTFPSWLLELTHIITSSTLHVYISHTTKQSPNNRIIVSSRLAEVE